jgi:tetratricopeptide (TPR) repeat protein
MTSSKTEIEILTLAQQPVLTSLPISVKGIVTNASAGYPVAGLSVIASMDWFAADSAAKNGASIASQARLGSGARAPVRQSGASGFHLGQGMTGADGRFAISFTAEPSIERALLVQRYDPFTSLKLEVRSAKGKLFTTAQVSGGQTDYFVPLAWPAPTTALSSGLWREFGERMMSGRVVQIHELARRLVAGAPPFKDWDVETRQSVLQELELNYLDPTGALRAAGVSPSFQALRQTGALQKYRDTLDNRVQNANVAQAFRELTAKSESFADIFAVDWVSDPEIFMKDKPGAAVNAFEETYVVGSAASLPDLGGWLDRLLHTPSPRSRYRDYLRTIYTGPQKTADYLSRLKKLGTRFHQDFETLDDDDQPANEVLIPILTAILTAGTDENYGLGKTGLPPRGAMSARDYVDALIGMSKLSAEELRLRYRVDFTRSGRAVSSPVRENIAALQGFFTDGFESSPDPYPLYEDTLSGEAPFFLQYDEWLQQTEPFYGENFYQMMQTFSFAAQLPSKYPGTNEQWINEFQLVEEKMREGYRLFTQGQYQKARSNYDDAHEIAKDALVHAFPQKKAKDVVSAFSILTALTDKLAALKALPISGQTDLEAFMDFFVPSNLYINDYNLYKNSSVSEWIDSNSDTFKLALVHFLVAVLPVLRGDVALAAGDVVRAVHEYEKTTRFLMARADLTDSEGYDPFHSSPSYLFPTLIPDIEGGSPSYPRTYNADGILPYTTPRFRTGDDIIPDTLKFIDDLMRDFAAGDWFHPMEKSFFRLRHGEALLTWADMLYKTDVSGKIARAREVYKAVLWLHGADSDVAPHWSTEPGFHFRYRTQQENPAVTSQISRARLALWQIEAGLNFYGWNDSLVPTLRYRPLKDAADRFAATAKSAQQDFLLYMAKIEDAIRDGVVNEHMLKKATLQGQLAEEQVAVAKVNVDLAQRQLQTVKDAIAAKEKEIADSEDFFNQLTTFISGMQHTIKEMPEWMTKPAWRGVQSAAGIQLSSDALLTGTAAGAAMMSGYGLFIYAGYASLSSMVDAQNSLQSQLQTLQNQALPIAQEQLQVRQTEVTMATVSHQIAQGDADLAQALLTFQAERFLNTELWARLATVMKRVMQRFLDLGGRFAWLAERALAFEQDTTVRIIRLNYFPQTLQGLTGADLLQTDLAELEAFRLSGLQQTVPVRRAFSLAFDFPLAFGQLKKTGACIFATQESTFQQAYPGTYGYRLQAVSITAAGLNVLAPVRGLLSNLGVSTLSRSDGKTHCLLRNQDALPLSAACNKIWRSTVCRVRQ